MDTNQNPSVFRGQNQEIEVVIGDTKNNIIGIMNLQSLVLLNVRVKFRSGSEHRYGDSIGRVKLKMLHLLYDMQSIWIQIDSSAW